MYNNVLSVDNTGIFFGDRKALFIMSKQKEYIRRLSLHLNM